MIELIVTCALTLDGTFTPPADWAIVEIAGPTRDYNAGGNYIYLTENNVPPTLKPSDVTVAVRTYGSVTLKRTAKAGEKITLPNGCNTVATPSAKP